MKHIHCKIYVRMFAATLVAIATVILSALAAHTPVPNQSPLTLESIRTDNTALFYADDRGRSAWFVEAVATTGKYTSNRVNRAWFVEAVAPTGKYASNRVNRAWFVEAVAPTGNSDIVTDNLKSVAARL